MKTSGRNKEEMSGGTFRPLLAVSSFVVLLVVLAIFQQAGGFGLFTRTGLSAETDAEYRNSVTAFNTYTEDFTKLGNRIEEAAAEEKELSSDFRRDARWDIQDLNEQAESLQALPLSDDAFLPVLQLQKDMLGTTGEYLDTADRVLETSDPITPEQRARLREQYEKSAAASTAVSEAYQEAYEILEQKEREIAN